MCLTHVQHKCNIDKDLCLKHVEQVLVVKTCVKNELFTEERVKYVFS